MYHLQKISTLISVLKCPVGTSGISQPNDLMKVHLIFRKAYGLGECWKNLFLKRYTSPKYWTQKILPYFKASGVSAASTDTYGYIFSTLKNLIAKSFRVEIVQKGMRAQMITYLVTLSVSLQYSVLQIKV
jgi:hypothetical protein